MAFSSNHTPTTRVEVPQKDISMLMSLTSPVAIPPPVPLNLQGAAYDHEGFCSGADCQRCYKYGCVECGARSNRMMESCWRCGK